jgi:hypothetical protein
LLGLKHTRIAGFRFTVHELVVGRYVRRANDAGAI